MFDRWSIRTRLAASFGTIMLLLIAIVIVGITRMAAIHESMKIITEKNNAEMALGTTVRGANFEVSVSVRNLMLYTDDTQLRREGDKLRLVSASIDDALSRLDQMFTALPNTTEAQKALLQKGKAQWITVGPASSANAALRVDLYALTDLEQKLNEDVAAQARHGCHRRAVLSKTTASTIQKESNHQHQNDKTNGADAPPGTHSPVHAAPAAE